MVYTSSDVFFFWFSVISSSLILAIDIAFEIHRRKPLNQQDIKKLNDDEIKFMKSYVEEKNIPFTFNPLKNIEKQLKRK